MFLFSLLWLTLSLAAYHRTAACSTGERAAQGGRTVSPCSGSSSSSNRPSAVVTSSSNCLTSSASSFSSLTCRARAARKASVEGSRPSPAALANAGGAGEGTPAPRLDGAPGHPCGPATSVRSAGRVPGRGALCRRRASHVPCSPPSCLALTFLCCRSESCCSTSPALWWSFFARASCTAVRTCRCHARGRRSLRRSAAPLPRLPSMATARANKLGRPTAVVTLEQNWRLLVVVVAGGLISIRCR